MGARALAALALAAGLLWATPLGAAPAPRSGMAVSQPASPSPAAAAAASAKAASVLTHYLEMLDVYSAPKYVSFEYSVEQSGGTNISQVHRIYRAGRDQRDEVIEEDGRRLKPARVRIRHDSVDRYALSAVAPAPERYAFTFVGSTKSGDHVLYRYRTEARTAAPFTVEEISLDGTSYLPAMLRFRSSSGGVHGHGELLFATAEKHWMIREARIDALSKGAPVSERIVWSAYRFPSSLPSATFADQVPEPAPLPSLPP